MTQFLPPNLLALFAAREPIPYLPPVDKLSWEKKTDGYSGIAYLIARFEDPSETPAPKKVETKEERLERKRREKAEQMQYKLEQEIALWDPHNAEAATTDPYKTLFVARINYDTSESKLRREFEIYGPIKKIIVHNKITGKPRGYAFIEYEHERDMHSAYKHADGKKIDNRRVLVDVERARTVKGWLPRRLGGGLGGTRKGGPDVNVKHSGREDDRKRGRSEDHRISRERERTRERERERDRDSRRSRDRDRDRERERERERERRRKSRRSPANDVVVDGARERKRRRSRSRDRERPEEEERRRHRSKSRERRKRSRSRERKHRRDRDRERERNRGENDPTLESMKIKQEPEDDYPDYPSAPIGAGVPPIGGTYYNNYPLKDEDERPKNGTKYEDEDANAEIDY